MPLTSAEKQRRYRDRLKADGQYDNYQKRQAVSSKKCRNRKKCDQVHFSVQLRQKRNEQREATRRRVAKCRKMKKEKAAAFKQKSPFNSAQAFAKATFRARRLMDKAMPHTPKRRKAVCKSLYRMECGEPSPSRDEEQGISTGLGENFIKEIQRFFERDDISRQAPGRKDVVTVWDQKGTKTKHQRRHLTSSIMETYAMFKEEHPDIKVGKSKFAELRPKHVLLSSKLPHNVCLCKYHENFINAVAAVHKVFPEYPAYSHDLPQQFLCQEPTRSCWLNECNNCMNAQGLQRVYGFTESADTKWLVWKTDDGRMVKTEEEGTTEELLDYIRGILPQFLEHCFIKREQASTSNKQRDKALSEEFDENVAILQVDFSENFTCVSQDEVQSAHWNQKQVSLFTAALWHSGSIHSHVLASDNLVHSKDTVIAYMDRMLDCLPGGVKSVSVWSDGPASQFKNRFIAAAVAALEKKHKIQMEWNFFVTSHGKGPVDGIGGSAKRYVWNKVTTRKSIVTNAASFVNAASDMINVMVSELTEAEIESRNRELNLTSVFSEAKHVSGIKRMHFLKHTSNEVVAFILSKDNQPTEEIMQDIAATTTVIQIGDWYAVDYEGILFPGEVVAIGEENDYQVSVMEPSGQNWKWPNPRDVIYYPKRSMVIKLDNPEIANNRCHFKFVTKF